MILKHMFALTNAPTVFNVQLAEILFARTAVGIYKNALREKSKKIHVNQTAIDYFYSDCRILPFRKKSLLT